VGGGEGGEGGGEGEREGEREKKSAGSYIVSPKLKNFGSEFHFTGFRIYDIVFGTRRAQEAISQCSQYH
jgi:hypothetical protein